MNKLLLLFVLVAVIAMASAQWGGGPYGGYGPRGYGGGYGGGRYGGYGGRGPYGGYGGRGPYGYGGRGPYGGGGLVGALLG
ncbi:Neuropeptide-Like Protein [Caenorhabditis elegans]|uniref:Neuropeptide-Like Protein n=1 Tax=Caenorhabditis elegans TaxID=6239 RepID=Q20011_CAEEL|nr:Neuropeptide-Like Protein [Caenorhabditis elegans]CAA98464.2 Neuropeptide-Like Protein [Caenorhabditis elegans]|eukprot:NP_505946.2 Neuropeptide-Like Protein [Caenorhabditis elegans]